MLEDKIYADLKSAMKEKNEAKVSALRMLRSSILNVKIDKKVEKLEDADVIQVLSRDIKKIKESIESFQKGNRPDLVANEEAGLAVLQVYMPAQMSMEEVKQVVKDAIAETGATTKKDMGGVMKIVTEKTRGRADGKLVSEIVSQELK